MSWRYRSPHLNSGQKRFRTYSQKIHACKSDRSLQVSSKISLHHLSLTSRLAQRSPRKPRCLSGWGRHRAQGSHRWQTAERVEEATHTWRRPGYPDEMHFSSKAKPPQFIEWFLVQDIMQEKKVTSVLPAQSRTATPPTDERCIPKAWLPMGWRSCGPMGRAGDPEAQVLTVEPLGTLF